MSLAEQLIDRLIEAKSWIISVDKKDQKEFDPVPGAFDPVSSCARQKDHHSRSICRRG